MSDIQEDEATEFGDVDPEDEWDDTDPFRLRLEILERIIENIRERRDDRFKVRLGMALDLLRAMIREHHEDRERLDRIEDALEELEED